MLDDSIYARPRLVTRVEDCYFYHTMDIPGYGHVKGVWDLRKGADKYLGNVDLRNKRVLEIGPASGFVCFYMESKGAEVVAYDLSDEQQWDIVPYSQYNYADTAKSQRERIRQINNSYWLCHKAYQSKAKVVYGSAYEIPEAIGSFHISTLCSVLLHLRDPFLALQRTLSHTAETVIVTEPVTKWHFPLQLLSKFLRPYMVFAPDFREVEPKETWWVLTPSLVKVFIGILGFEKTEVKYHFQEFRGQRRLLYTVVGHRTRPFIEH